MNRMASENVCRVVNGLVASQNGMLSRTVFDEWKKALAETAQSKEAERVNQEVEKKRTREEERAVAAAYMLMGSQDSMITGTIFKMWKDLRTEARHLKELQRLQSDIE